MLPDLTPSAWVVTHCTNVSCLLVLLSCSNNSFDYSFPIPEGVARRARVVDTQGKVYGNWCCKVRIGVIQDVTTFLTLI